MGQHYIFEAVGGYILRGDNPIFVKSNDMARELFILQDENYSFRPMMKTE